MWVFQVHRHHLNWMEPKTSFSYGTGEKLHRTQMILIDFPGNCGAKCTVTKNHPCFNDAGAPVPLLCWCCCSPCFVVWDICQQRLTERKPLYIFLIFFLERKPLEKSVFQNRTHQEKGSNDRKGKTLGERILQHRTHRERGLSCNWKRRRPKRCSH